MTIHRLLEYQPHEGGFHTQRARTRSTPTCSSSTRPRWSTRMLFRAVTRGAAASVRSSCSSAMSISCRRSAPAPCSHDVIALRGRDGDPADRDLPPGRAEQDRVSAPTRSTTARCRSSTPPGERTSDFYFIDRDDPEAARDTIVELVAERIPARFGLDPITRGPGARRRCTAASSAPHGAQPRAAGAAQPAAEGDIELVRGDRAFRRGDKVMQLKNDYDRNVFNGDIGVIESVDPRGQRDPRRLRRQGRHLRALRARSARSTRTRSASTRARARSTRRS